MGPADVSRLERKIDKLTDDVNAYKLAAERRITRLEVKAGVWGGLAGLIAAVTALLAALHR